MDAESGRHVAQVKHVRRLSLAELEALPAEIAAIGEQRGELGLLVVKRRAGRGQPTPRLVVLTEDVWRAVHGTGLETTVRCSAGGESGAGQGVEKERVREH